MSINVLDGWMSKVRRTTTATMTRKNNNKWSDNFHAVRRIVSPLVVVLLGSTLVRAAKTDIVASRPTPRRQSRWVSLANAHPLDGHHSTTRLVNSKTMIIEIMSHCLAFCSSWRRLRRPRRPSTSLTKLAGAGRLEQHVGPSSLSGLASIITTRPSLSPVQSKHYNWTTKASKTSLSQYLAPSPWKREKHGKKLEWPQRANWSSRRERESWKNLQQVTISKCQPGNILLLYLYCASSSSSSSSWTSWFCGMKQ